MNRIVVLVNKDFEYAGFIEGLREVVPVYAGTNGRQAECRFDNLLADIYCIQNLFKEDENSSNSEVKYGYLKNLFKRNAFRLDEVNAVVSISTAETTPVSQKGYDKISRNGSVFVGNKFFLSDQRDNDPTTQSHLPIKSETMPVGEYYDVKPIGDFYDTINCMRMPFKNAPNNSDIEPKCYADPDFMSVGVVNVMDYTCYEKADATAYAQAAFSTNPICIETTHGVIVKALKETCDEMNVWQIPVTFISPIVDRYMKFDEDVDGKYGKQNFVCSYNGGVATGHILRILNASMS